MKKSLAFLFGCVVGSAISLSAVRADDAKVEFFEKKIRPLLVQHCYECHSTQSKKLGGELLLDHRQGILQGGESGAAIEPGNPQKSLLIQAVRYEDEALRMPPKGKLPAESLADLEAWIKMGAPDPRDSPASTSTSTNTSWEEIFRTRRDWWSLRPVNRPPVPVPQDVDWSQEPVDRFIRVGLEAKGLRPGRPADAETLARRLSLVLTGLPATVEVIDAFAAAFMDSPAGGASSSPPADLDLRDKSTDRARQAIEALVDQLLNSPHFGERWARHWMDVVRFSETHGNEWNYEVHHAWRYRDYLIRAFNDDIPYDQFVREHIAGDLLPAPRWNKTENWNESVVATCFYRFGEVNHDDCISLRQIGYDLADNQIDTLTKAFQATTVACARCHDHKLDAISMRDYYALLGVLRSSRLVSHTIDAPDANSSLVERLRQLKRELNSELADLWMQDARQLARYMQAAQARRAKQDSAMDLASGLDPPRLEKWVAVLAAEKVPLDDPLEPWRAAASDPTDAAAFSEHWRRVAQRFVAEDQRRVEFNEREFATWADFRGMQPTDWQIGGQGLRSGPSRSGEVALHPEGNLLVKAVLPAGWFTHGLSEKLNGTLRSPVLPPGKKRVSFQVIGQRSSAVRLVSNHCQLNYKNYRALTSPEWTWVTFESPDEREQLRTYAELMTMFDNPKFPDQLSALGGDKDNYKLPWEKAAENPRSYFGITRVVVHDCAEPPAVELDHLRPLFDDSAALQPASLADVTLRYATLVETAIQNWASGRATDRDIRWLDALLRRGLLSNDITSSPQVSSLTQEYRQTETKLSLPRVAAGIADEGPGIWLGQNSFRIQELLAACARLGAMLCPANWRGTPAELAFAVDDLEPAVVVTQEEEVGGSIAAAVDAASHQPALQLAHDTGPYEALVAAHDPLAADPAVEASDPLLLVYTAAFAGTPNAAMLSHRALLAQGLLLADYTEVGPDDRYLCAGPLFHVGTFMFALATLVTGGTNVFVRRNDGEEVCRVLAEERCTGGYIVGTMVGDVAAANPGGRYDLSSFRGFRGHPQFDAMVSPDASRWGRRAGGYGQTELMGMATFPLLSPDGIGVHGRPSPLVAIRVVDPEGHDVAVGETGEFVARGVTVMNGYWNRPEENARRSRDGWHHTGDLGRYEADGTVTFVGPAGRMLKSGAENIYPAEVEACLRAHPAVADAAVIGVPDPTWVQSVKAVVVLAEPATEDELVAHCRAHLASYKKPRSVEVVDELPRLDTGPVDYAALDDQFGGGNYPGGTTRSV